jgi:hypothetical protein
MTRHFRTVGLAALAALALAGFGVAQAQPAAHKPQCFAANDWNGWKATPDSRAIYLRTGVSRIYRLDLANACPDLQLGGARLINKVRGGSGFICTALDLDLKVSTGHGFSSPCIVSKLTQLSPAEAAALPRSLRP